MDLTNMTVEQLESLAYRQVKLLEQTRVNIQIIEQEIAKRSKEEPKKE